MPSAPIVTWARSFPLLAAVTPRSRYLKKERRPATSGAVVGVACASLPGGFTAAGCLVGVLAWFIMEPSSSSYRRYYPIHARLKSWRGSSGLREADIASRRTDLLATAPAPRLQQRRATLQREQALPHADRHRFRAGPHDDIRDSHVPTRRRRPFDGEYRSSGGGLRRSRLADRGAPQARSAAERFSIDKPETTWDERRCGERSSSRGGVDQGRPTGEGAAARRRLSRTPDRCGSDRRTREHCERRGDTDGHVPQ